MSGEIPVSEWFGNGDMNAGAFLCLFMRVGQYLPQATWLTPPVIT